MYYVGGPYDGYRACPITLTPLIYLVSPDNGRRDRDVCVVYRLDMPASRYRFVGYARRDAVGKYQMCG